MKLSNVKIFREEDFQDQMPWIRRLLTPISQFFTDVTNMLNGGLVTADNFKWQTFERKLQAGVTSFNFRWLRNEPPIGVILLYLKEIGSSSVPATGIYWEYSDGSVSVELTGLDPAKEYQIRVQGIV